MQYSTGMLTTVLPKEKLRLVSPFIMFRLQPFEKVASRTASLNYRNQVPIDPSDLVATARHASTSAWSCVGEKHRIAFSESNLTSENGISIERVSRRRLSSDIFL
jgi:hypothetical protein